MSMTQNVWEEISGINDLLVSLREQVAADSVDLVALRSGLRSHLDRLRAIVTGQYSERDAYFVLFPLTAHCDEIIKSLLLEMKHLQWPPLQQELYQVNDAGDIFYELLDQLLSKPDTPQLIFAIYFFCLNDGFRGRYVESGERISSYVNKLREHIRLAPIDAPLPPVSPDIADPPLKIPAYAFYGAAVFLLAVVYWLLEQMADSWYPIN